MATIHRVELIKTYLVETDDREDLERISKNWIEKEKHDNSVNLKVNITEMKCDEDCENEGIYELCQKLTRYDAVMRDAGVLAKTQHGVHAKVRETLMEITDQFEKLMKGELN